MTRRGECGEESTDMVFDQRTDYGRWVLVGRSLCRRNDHPRDCGGVAGQCLPLRA